MSKTSGLATIRNAGGNLRHLIDSAGLRRDFVSREAGIHPSRLSHLMAGRISFTPYYAERLAPVLGVTPEDLLFPPQATPPAGPLSHHGSPRAGDSEAGRGGPPSAAPGQSPEGGNPS